MANVNLGKFSVQKFNGNYFNETKTKLFLQIIQSCRQLLF